MIVVLGGLVLGALLIGFSLLAAVPLMFACLGYAVFREGRTLSALAALPEGGDMAVPMPAVSPAPPTPEAAIADAAREVAREPERPRTMVAGRRPRN